MAASDGASFARCADAVRLADKRSGAAQRYSNCPQFIAPVTVRKSSAAAALATGKAEPDKGPADADLLRDSGAASRRSTGARRRTTCRVMAIQRGEYASINEFAVLGNSADQPCRAGYTDNQCDHAKRRVTIVPHDKRHPHQGPMYQINSKCERRQVNDAGPDTRMIKPRETAKARG